MSLPKILKRQEGLGAVQADKKQTQRECRMAYTYTSHVNTSHVNSLMNDDQTSYPKKLISFVKNKKYDASGVAHGHQMRSIIMTV